MSFKKSYDFVATISLSGALDPKDLRRRVSGSAVLNRRYNRSRSPELVDENNVVALHYDDEGITGSIIDLVFEKASVKIGVFFEKKQSDALVPEAYVKDLGKIGLPTSVTNTEEAVVRLLVAIIEIPAFRLTFLAEKICEDFRTEIQTTIKSMPMAVEVYLTGIEVTRTDIKISSGTTTLQEGKGEAVVILKEPEYSALRSALSGHGFQCRGPGDEISELTLTKPAPGGGSLKAVITVRDKTILFQETHEMLRRMPPSSERERALFQTWISEQEKALAQVHTVYRELTFGMRGEFQFDYLSCTLDQMLNNKDQSLPDALRSVMARFARTLEAFVLGDVYEMLNGSIRKSWPTASPLLLKRNGG